MHILTGCKTWVPALPVVRVHIALSVCLLVLPLTSSCPRGGAVLPSGVLEPAARAPQPGIPSQLCHRGRQVSNLSIYPVEIDECHTQLFPLPPW